MGYDMHTVVKPEGEARAVAKAHAARAAAIQVRDAFPRSDQGQYSQEELRSGAPWDGPAANATSAYAAAHREAHRLYEVMGEVERSYFRLNIWGMSRVRQAMESLGMAYESVSHAEWPHLDWESPVGRVAEALSDDDGRTTETDAEWASTYFAKHYPESAFTDADVEQAAAHCATHNAILSEHPAGGDTIPLHKLGSNDGWIVTPRECLNALTRWHAASEAERDDALSAAGIDLVEDPAWAKLWCRWLAFLELAAHCDGFEVH